jgi:diacylglycerol kinase (ATP)
MTETKHDRNDPDQNKGGVAIVVNSLSGSADIDLDALVTRIRNNGSNVVSVEGVEDPSNLSDQVRRAAAQAETVVIGGGDGTISQSLAIIKETGRTLGVLPLGTANDFARSLGIPHDPDEAADIIPLGARRSIDLGEVNGQLFCNSVSIGFPVEVAASHERSWKKLLGLFSYPIAWTKAVVRFRSFDVVLRNDGQENALGSLFALTVMNGRYHGGGLTVDEEAQIDDGLLKIYSIEAVSKWKLIAYFLSLKIGKLLRDRHTNVLRAASVEISSRKPKPINIDGDIREKTPASVRVIPDAIDVIVPPGNSRPDA